MLNSAEIENKWMRTLKMRPFITEVFKKEVKPALGCTEAATIGIVSSLALNAALDNLDSDLGVRRKNEAKEVTRINSLSLTLDPNLFKNAADVGIPRTDGKRGIKLAAASSLFGDPRKGLMIFDSVEKKHLKIAGELTKLVGIKIKSELEGYDVYAEAEAKTGKAWGRAIIQHEHDNVVLVESSRGTFFKGGISEKVEGHERKIKNLTIDDLTDYVTHLPGEVVSIVRKGIELVKKLSDEGLGKPMGMGVGYALKNGDTRAWIRARTASACDARMFGSPNPSMAVAGSGNQGITSTMPIYAYAERNKMGEDLLIRSVALSYLVTIYATYHSSYLSAMCGCATKAGIGSSAGLAYYISRGDKGVVKRAIQNFIADIPGIVCDGGKYSCALKLATISDAIHQSALLALHNKEPPYTNGILERNAEGSIRNLGEIFKAVKPAQKAIVEIISKKHLASFDE
jgi:L-cysteine desulfidase